MKQKIILIIVWAIAPFSLTSFGQNPIVQSYYTIDPAPMVYSDTVYLYTSHDEDETVSNFFTKNDWECYSSTDMVNRTDSQIK